MKLWYRVSTGLVERPLLLVALVVAIASLTYPWLVLLHLVPLATWLYALSTGLMTVAILAGVFASRHRRMANLYWGSSMAALVGDLTLAKRLSDEADAMRFLE